MLATFAVAGCNTTTIGWSSLAPGQEIVLEVESGFSTVRVINGGPGTFVVTSDAEGTDIDTSKELAAGLLDLDLRGKTIVTIANRGSQASSLRIDVPDPASITLSQRAIQEKETGAR